MSVNDEDFEALVTAEPMMMSSLCVNVDFLELVEKYGDEQSWVILGQLKDLLG